MLERARTRVVAEQARPVSSEPAGVTGRETAEREAAWRRGAERARSQAEGQAPARHPYRGIARPEVAQRAFAALAENMRDYAIFLTDAEGVITFWGEGSRLIKGWTREQAEGAHLRLVYPDGGSEDGTAEAHLEAAAETGEYTGEGHRIRSDGSSFWAGVTLTALRDTEGALLGYVKLTRDLTAQRAAESARRAALESAEEASRAKSAILATVSHEIRTPLGSIVAYTDLLKMGVAGPLGPKHHEYLDRMRASSHHLQGLVEDLLDLSRAEAGRLQIGREKLTAGTIVAQALAVVDPEAKKRQVEVVDAVSGFAGDQYCWGDAARVRQALLNLIGNAIKFTEPGGRVVVSAGGAAEPPPDAELDRSAGPWVYFRVEDTGWGIAPEHLERIFEPFVQVLDRSPGRRPGGTGLGLAISRQLARRMGGDVTVRSEPGVGSSFFLWLRAAARDDTADAAAPAAAGAATNAGTLQEIRDAVLAELERILRTYAARLRSDRDTPSAASLPEPELEDHLASFLADIAQTLASMPLAPGTESESLRDGTAIQRTIADRHGRQRARLGWSEPEIRREFVILGEELAAAVRRRVRRPREEQVDEVIAVVKEFLDRAEAIALTSYRLERET